MALLVGRCVHGMNGKVTWSAIVVSLVVLLDLIALAPPPAFAQIARVEMHAFASATLTDQQFLTGQRDGPPSYSRASCAFRGPAPSGCPR